MQDENYIDHEVRLRVLESLTEKINTKMNILITVLVIGCFILPVMLQHFGI